MMRLGNVVNVFQSTLSMRRATFLRAPIFCAIEFQSTLSMRRATGHVQRIVLRGWISIHALHEESDSYNDAAAFAAKFQSTLSMRRATGLGVMLPRCL